MRPILPEPSGKDWQRYAHNLVAAIQTNDLWRETIRIVDAVLPEGSTTLFVEAAVPAGWKDAAGGLGDKLLRTASVGAVTGGSWQLSGLAISAKTLTVANLPAHQHGVSTDAEPNHTHSYEVGLGGAHSHSAATSSVADHTHSVSSQSNPGDHVHIFRLGGGTGTGTPTGSQVASPSTVSTSTDGNHAHDATMSSSGSHQHTGLTDASSNHTHSVSLASAADHIHTVSVTQTGGGAAHSHSFTAVSTWRPSYVDTRICERLPIGQEPPRMPLPVPEGSWPSWSPAFGGAARLGFQQLDEWLGSRVDIIAPRGKRMVFAQSAAPLGWVQDTTWNDRMLRVANGDGGGTGGSWALSGIAADLHVLTESEIPAHTHSATVSAAGAHEHTVAMGPGGSHAHTFTTSIAGDHTHAISISTAGSHAHTVPFGTVSTGQPSYHYGSGTGSQMWFTMGLITQSHTHSLVLANVANHFHSFTTDGALAHSHSLSIAAASHAHTISVQAVGGGLGHSHSLSATASWRLKYLDCIVAYRL